MLTAIFSESFGRILAPLFFYFRGLLQYYYSTAVHGDELRDNDKIIEINDTKMEVEDLAVDFLRCTLLYILKNPEYLDAKKFDECIDGIIAKYKKMNAND